MNKYGLLLVAHLVQSPGFIREVYYSYPWTIERGIMVNDWALWYSRELAPFPYCNGVFFVIVSFVLLSFFVIFFVPWSIFRKRLPYHTRFLLNFRIQNLLNFRSALLFAFFYKKREAYHRKKYHFQFFWYTKKIFDNTKKTIKFKFFN